MASSLPPTDAEPALRADARRNRERLLEVAREAFANDGLAVSTDEIARRAGVGPGTIYRHFPNKDALFGAVVRNLLEQLRDDAVALAHGPDPGVAFFTYFARVLNLGTTNRALFEALASGGDELKASCADVSDDLSGALAELLARAQAAGAARADLTGEDLKAILVGALAAQGMITSEASRARITEVTCNGLRA